MSQWEDDAGIAGDELADLVEMLHLSDLDALAYLTGDPAARRKVDKALEEAAGEYGHESQDAYDEGRL